MTWLEIAVTVVFAWLTCAVLLSAGLGRAFASAGAWDGTGRRRGASDTTRQG